MIATISPKDYDVSGPVSIDYISASTDTDTVSRRVQKTATLDGDSVIVDHGYSDTDRTLSIQISNISEAKKNRLQDILSLNTRVYASVGGNVWECAPVSLTRNGIDANLRLYIVSKASA